MAEVPQTERMLSKDTCCQRIHAVKELVSPGKLCRSTLMAVICAAPRREGKNNRQEPPAGCESDQAGARA
ncbi:hypothetical protein WH50_12000 [Pokkaliibacter plantistimulans]|uniref:Transposase n=1 Tax=Pokkaliibacter plantistimulans TaxID=1635171 RepID=A0ABX5LWD2_9GAMM|nr:hypothetical protein WH50_12000 [Pokkaliibacter plantistimulans]